VREGKFFQKVPFPLKRTHTPTPLPSTANQLLRPDNLEDAFYSIFPHQVYKGKREASVINWIIDRITDGRNGIYPREFITLCNNAKSHQISRHDPVEDCLIAGNSVKEAFIKTSVIKCETYLSEFHGLRNRFARFQVKTATEYSRNELIELMNDLEPSGEEMIRQLYETGILTPKGMPSASAKVFEIPKLYRSGLGIVVRGRP